MATFLEQLAEAILAEHGTALRNVAVVLPSQRAGLYLRNALARKAGTALWSPEVFTLGSFMEHRSALRTLPIEELLFEAYEAYRSVAGEGPRSFDDFITWASVTLADISEADAHLVSLSGFYRDLRSWEELDWSFNTTPLSDGQQRMVRYWALCGKLHTALNERSLKSGSGTAGLVERSAAENLAPMPWSRIWFAGLNAFTPAEQKVIDHARAAGLARFAWDADRHYVDDPQQEAGQHLRAAIARYGAGNVPPSATLGSLADLRVVRAPNPAAQAWCAADLIRSLTEEERARTALVLADESLLPAILEALPGDLGALNITMGLSLAQLPVGSLIEAFFRMLATTSAHVGWLFNDIERLLRHPFLLHGSAGARVEELLAELRASHLLVVSPERLREAIGGFSEDLRPQAMAMFGLVDRIDPHGRVLGLLGWAQRTMEKDDFATEQIYQASIILQRMLKLTHRYGHAAETQQWVPVMSRLLRAARVGLFGEPLHGLQVMGLLESRALDHHRLIVLGAQEGKLPSSTIDRSYIPFELRRAYGLPLRDSTDAVQAYNFMRMIQRAQAVVLVHADDGTANGPSRYIAQLEHELMGESARSITALDARVPVPVRASSHVSVPNDAAARDQVRRLLEKGFSPTMLRTWLKCPLDFWFRYVRRSREPDVPGPRIEGNVLGEALHATLENIYRPWLGVPLRAEALRTAIPAVHDALHDRLLKKLPEALLRSGQPLLQLDMAVRAAGKFLRSEAEAVEAGTRIVPVALETELRVPLRSSSSATGSEVALNGRIDRVDERDGMVHILDLKTGRVDERTLRIKEIRLDALRGDKGFAAQLLVYAWLYLTTHPEVDAVRSGLMPMQRSSASDGLYLHVDGDDRITRALLQPIEEMLTNAVQGMLDPERPFVHDVKSRYCVFCAEGR